MDIGTRIKEARKAANMTQQQLADAVGVYAKDVCRWERGEFTPNLKTFADICMALGASADDLLGIKNNAM